jgi:hypothetical protein
MTESSDFENELREGMKRATAPVVAHEDLHSRLIGTASSARPEARLRTSYFPGWALPLAAAVITALAVGSVVLASHDGHSSGVVSGNGTSLPSVTSSARPTPTPRASVTTRATTNPTATRHSSVARTTQSSPTAAASTSQARPSATPRPKKTAPAALANCSVAPHGTSNPTSVAEFTRRIIGTWLVCSSPSALATSDAGLQITADGHWAKLFRDKAGRLVKGSGLHDGGTWEVLDDSAMNGHPAFQLNLMTGSSTYVLLADFAAAVNRIRYDNNGAYAADYVPTSEPVLAG